MRNPLGNPWPRITASRQRLVAALHSPHDNKLALEADSQLHSQPQQVALKDNGMTSSVPLQTYRSPREYSDDFDGSPARKNTLSYEEGVYDPYADSDSLGKPWRNTAFAESTTDSDGMDKPSLSYGSKELSK